MQTPISKSHAGLVALLVVLLVDVGLFLWWWQWRRAAPPEDYSAEGLDMAVGERPREQSPPASEPASKAPYAPLLALKEPLGPAAPRAGARSEARRSLARAASSFLALQRKPRYRKSPVIREWTRDFLACPDLKEINRRYWRDRDPAAFIVATLRSPSFAKMLKRYAASPDLSAFVQELMASPGVMASGRALMEDKNVLAAAKDLTLPGLPPLGALMAAGQALSQSQRPKRRD